MKLYTGKPLRGYSGKQLDIVGQATVQVIYEQQVTDLPLVIIRCGNYKVTINQCVEKKVYPLPTTEDLFVQMAEGQVFSKLDISQAYQQLTLDEDSKNLLVVNLPKGLF